VIKISRFSWFGSSGKTGSSIRQDTKDAVRDALDDHYQVRRVREGTKNGLFGSTYYVDLRDGTIMKVKVDKRSSWFGGEETYIKSIDE